MEQKKICTGVIGAGAISDIYLKNMINRFDNLYVKSICAAHLESAQKKAQEYGIQADKMEGKEVETGNCPVGKLKTAQVS